jgi:hypothetical protein
MVEWDSFSDQPAHMRDKKFKRDTRRRYPGDILVSALTILLVYPVVLLRYLFGFKKREQSLARFFGMAVNLDKEPELTPALLDELNVNELLVRIHMDAYEDFDRYEAFVKSLGKRPILFVLIPSRAQIEDRALLKQDCMEIFTRFSPYSTRFQIGNAINRIKWGFVLPKEYLLFFKTIQSVRDEAFKDIRLIGPAVIDFEYHVTIRAVFNFFNIRYDALSALLYVDRRGAPENRQFVFDTRAKINLLRAICNLSPKITNKAIYITEANWPIVDTGKYAPTSNYERVSETDYMTYMVRYYLLAAATGQVQTVYWHQLIAPGYGLVDNREGIRKREAFKAYRFMNSLLKGSSLHTFKQVGEYYRVVFTEGTKRITALWCNGISREIEIPETSALYSITGVPVEHCGSVHVNDLVQYLIEEIHG